jgi:hypothetical protein
MFIGLDPPIENMKAASGNILEVAAGSSSAILLAARLMGNEANGKNLCFQGKLLSRMFSPRHCFRKHSRP